MDFLKYKMWKSFIIFILIVVILLLIFQSIISISFPFIISLILSYLLSPMVNYFDGRGLKRTTGILITYLVVLIILITLSYSFIPMFYKSLAELIKSLPAISEKASIILSELIIRYQISELPDGVKTGISQSTDTATAFLNNMYSIAFGSIGVFLSNIFFIVLIPFITFYILSDSKYLKSKILMCIPSKFRTDSILTWYQIDLSLKRFIQGELLIALIVGTLTSVGMYVIGVKYAIALGFIAGVTNLIPYLGPFIGVVPSILVALLESPTLALKALLVFFMIQQIESGVISPKIVGNSVGLHPVTVIFVILLFEQFFGFIGMFFAVPITTVIIIIYNRIILRLNREKIF